MNRLMNGRKLRLLIELCYMNKAERMKEQVCNILAPENEILCQKVAEMSQSASLALRLDWDPAPVPVPRLLVQLKHYYDLAYVCVTSITDRNRPIYFGRLLQTRYRKIGGKNNSEVNKQRRVKQGSVFVRLVFDQTRALGCLIVQILNTHDKESSGESDLFLTRLYNISYLL